MEGTLIQTSVFADFQALADFLEYRTSHLVMDRIIQVAILLNDDGLWECSYPVYTEETHNAA